MFKIIDKTFDVVIIGSGGAGGAAASAAVQQGANVLVVSKDPLICSDSKISEGIVTVRNVGENKDSESNLSTNMRVEGSDIGDPRLIQTFAQDSKKAYKWLEKWGLKANRSQKNSNKKSYAELGGHNKPRSVIHPNGGLDYGHSVWQALLQNQSAISFIEDAWCLEIITTEQGEGNVKQVIGCLIYHAASGEIWRIKAPSIVLACGGLSTLYFPHTDTMRGNTGDGYAMAARLGCELVDMEQIQFIPFALVGPKSFEGLVVGEPASAGPLGVLRDRNGNILMKGIMRRNRAEVAAAMAQAIAQGKGTDKGGCYLDLTRNVEGPSGAMFYRLFSTVGHAFVKNIRAAQGVKASLLQEPWEVKPCAHYCMGGIRVNEQGEAISQRDIKGLLAAGQVLGGLHGGNRLGSTSLAENVIFGLRAGNQAAWIANTQTIDHKVWQQKTHTALRQYTSLLGAEYPSSASELTIQLQKVAWEYFGPTRTGDKIKQGIKKVAVLKQKLQRVKISNNTVWNQSFIDYVELCNLITCAELIGLSALKRPLSAGAHVRSDKLALLSKVFDCLPYSLSINIDKPTASLSSTSVWNTTKIKREHTPLMSALAHKTKKQVGVLSLALLYGVPQQRLTRVCNLNCVTTR